ncbi:MAG: aldo/keto reductase [Burkholderiales bacterium]|nr:aldo/keto reductase [Burkholderiales bacterium]
MTTIERQLSLAGYNFPRVGLGCMGMSDFYSPPEEEKSLLALHAAFELGYRHFDTADMYGNGANERLLGRFLRELGSKRSDVLLATKVGIKRVAGDKPAIAVDSSPEHVRAAVDASLARLGVEQIGLLYLHRKTPDVPIEDTVGAFDDLIRAGKVRAIGLSEVSIETLARAHAVVPVAALQNEYSLWTRDVETDTLAFTQRHGIAFVAYSPLGRGFLTGAFQKPASAGDLRAHLPRFQDGNFDANALLVDKLRDIAADIGALPAQVALAWVLSRQENIVVIPGSTNPVNLANNFAALNITLSAQHKAQLEDIFRQDAIQGGRYPAEILKTVNV